MKKLLILLILVFSCGICFAGDYVQRFPTGTAIEVYNSSDSDDRYVNADGDTMTGDLTVPDIIIPDFSLGTPTYSTLNDYLKLAMSSGRISGGMITDAGSQTVNVSAGTGWIKAEDSDTAQLMFCDWAGSNGISIPTDTVRYIGVKYSGGSAIITTETDNSWDLDTEFPLGSVINLADTLYILNNPWWVSDGLTNIFERFQAMGYTVRDNYVGGLMLGTSSVNTTRKPTLTAGTVWSRMNEFSITDKDCSGTDTFYGFYRDGGTGWSRTVAKTDIDDYYDNNSGTLQPLDNNKYVNFWVFADVDNVTNGQIMVIYPQTQYNTATEAEAGTIPVFPTAWYEHGVLVGRIIIKQGVTAPIKVETAFNGTFGYALAADHGNLSGLTDDDHTQYLLINGTRAMTGALGLASDAATSRPGDMIYSSSDDEPQYRDNSGNLHYMGSPKQITATDTSQAEGNNSLTGLANKYNIKWLFIETTSTDWTFTIYTKDDYATGELELIPNRDGDCYLYIDLPWQDADSTSEFHYNFTSASGSETHDITFYGEQMK